MEHLDFLIRDLALILVIAGITTIVFKKIKQPLVLGYVLAGFLASANFRFLPNIADISNINVWGELGVIFIMFALGLEFSFHKIANIGGSAIVTAMTVITAMVVIGYGVGTIMGWQKMDSIFLGGMISMSSTMIILKAYEEYGLKEKKYAQLVLGTLIIEDVAAIFMMIILSTLAVSKNVSGLAMGGDIAKLLLYLVLWLLLGIYIIPSLLRRTNNYLNSETLLIVSIGLCLAMVMIANFMGFSSALGAFIAGSILAGTVKREEIEELISPIKDLFGAIFFVSVGMLVNLSLIGKYIVPIIILTLVTILGQMVFSCLGVLLSGQSLRTAIGAGFSMVQIGEFSFIIASLGNSLGVTSDFLYPIVVSVSVITTFTTPIFIKNGEKAYKIISRMLPKKTLKAIYKYTSEKQNENEIDPDWHLYMRKYVPRTAITSVILLATYVIGTQSFGNWVAGYMDVTLQANIIAGIVTIILMLPTISMMFYKRNNVSVKLWLKDKANRLPLTAFKAFRMLICIFFVMLTLRSMADIPVWLMFLIALAIVGVSVKSDFMASRAIKIETRFVSNFNQRILEEKKQEEGLQQNYRWLDETLLVKEYEIKEIMVQDPEATLFARQRLGVQIIKIIKKDQRRHINNPSLNIKLEEGDRIVALGRAPNLESFDMVIASVCRVNKTPDVSLRDYTYRQVFTSTDVENHLLCIAVDVNYQHDFCMKTIQLSGLKEKYHAFVIGIERNALPIISPNKNTEIEEGDILWVLGTQYTADKFLKDGILS